MQHPLIRLIKNYGHTITDLNSNNILENFTDEEHYNREKDYLWRCLIFTTWKPKLANPYKINDKVYFVHDITAHHINNSPHHYETWLYGIDNHVVDCGAGANTSCGANLDEDGNESLGDDNQLTIYNKTITSYKKCQLTYKQIPPKDTKEYYTVLQDFTFTSLNIPVVYNDKAPIYDNEITHLCIVQYNDYFNTGLILRYKHRFFKVKKVIDFNNDHALHYLYLELLGDSTNLKGEI